MGLEFRFEKWQLVLILPIKNKMSDESTSLMQLVGADERYPIEAYLFVREALAFAADSMELGSCSETSFTEDLESTLQQSRRERHLTGQELCEAQPGIRDQPVRVFGKGRVEPMANLRHAGFRRNRVSDDQCGYHEKVEP